MPPTWMDIGIFNCLQQNHPSNIAQPYLFATIKFVQNWVSF